MTIENAVYLKRFVKDTGAVEYLDNTGTWGPEGDNDTKRLWFIKDGKITSFSTPLRRSKKELKLFEFPYELPKCCTWKPGCPQDRDHYSEEDRALGCVMKSILTGECKGPCYGIDDANIPVRHMARIVQTSCDRRDASCEAHAPVPSATEIPLTTEKIGRESYVYGTVPGRKIVIPAGKNTLPTLHSARTTPGRGSSKK